MIEPQADEGRRQLAVAAISFLVPLAIFFGWFFGVLPVGFNVVSLVVAALFVASLGARTVYKSRLVALGATWLATGCLTVLFWALLLSGFD